MDRRKFVTAIAGGMAYYGSRPVFTQNSRLGTTRTLNIGTAGGFQLGFKSYPKSFHLNAKELILTFDDGPKPGPTNAVLKALRDEQVLATFFLIGQNAVANPDLVKRIAAEGHTIGTHSNTHPMTMRDLRETTAKTDIEVGIQNISKIMENTTLAPFFRYPGFGDTPALNTWLGSRNIGVFGTDIWASDWITMTPDAQLSLLMKRIRSAGRGMVLLHDIRQQTADMMPDFLRQLKTEGYKIVHMVAGNSPAQFQDAPPNWSSETDRFLNKRSTHKTWPISTPFEDSSYD